MSSFNIITVEEKLHSWNSSDFEGSLDEVIKKLQEKKTELEKTNTDLRVEIKTEYGCYDEQWNSFNIYGRKKMSIKEFVEGDTRCIIVK